MRHLLLLSPSLLFACYSETSTKVFNSIPEVQITSHPNQVEFNELEEQIFTAQVSDTNHANEDLEVSWLLDEEIICDWETPQPGGLSDCVILFPSDIERVSVQVRDPVGAASTDTIEVKVIPSTPPQVDLLSPLAEQRYYSNALIQFEAQLSDIDEPAENLLLDWKSSIEGDLELEGTIDTNGLFTAARYLSEGEHYLDLTVQDSAGKSTAVSQIIKVGPENNTPTCNITDPESNIGFASGETVVFQAVVSDIELTPEELLISWKSDRDGELGESTADSTGHTNFSSSDLSIGTHSITLSVVDDAGAICSENILVQIGTAPNIQLASPGNGDNIRENTSVLFEGTILDAEDQSDEIAVSWISDIDGEVSTHGADSNGNFSFSTTLSPGNHNMSLKATDPIGLFS
ncbi:MAG: hypothetical protein VX278_23340, partial [Myxococcota bacterium]|nr:hypothetical protein [Myxococcota bacterium]